MKTKILSILALLLMTVTQGAWAQETLTVYEDGTKSSPFSPVYMNRFDTYTRSQYIIPAANLEAMNGKIITALKYYSNKSNYTSTCNVDVYLKEVSYTTFDEYTPTFETKSGIVYTGKLSIAGDGTLTITFTTPYTYNGGNLLIGMENTETGNTILSSFYGEIVTGTVAFGSSSTNRGDFIPKTTFTYETPSPQGSWNYDYTGAVQSFTAPYEGTYTLEAWGAQGGNWVKTDRSPGVGGRGGYASGTVTLAKNQTIYIYVGGQGATTENQQSGGAGGWNGGGTGGNSARSWYVGAGGGGGASHVSLSNAQVIGTDVTTLSGTNYLIVAGGGGGAVTWAATAGAGGGTEGGAGATAGGTSLSPWYNSTLSTGRNGYNGDDYSFSGEGTGGGGGGYLGGNAGTVTSGTSNQDCGGCGGSSNYNSTYVSNFTTTSDVREGAGKVTITFLSGEGTEDSPYLIASTTDWDNLVSAVNGGETYSGNYFKMTANVGDVTPVSTWMTGTFSGTFDGDGNTLTVDYDASTEGCAPFGTLSGATIQKLKVAGSISSNQKLVAGIAALCSSTGNNVTNCLVSATINSSYNGNAADGGLVAVVDNDASLNVTGCAFAGKLLTTNGTTSCGGIVGWRRPSGTVTITNCLYAPTSATGSETWIATAEGENGNANFCRWNSSEPTIANCYYTTDFGSGDYTAQGIQARTIAKGDYVSTLSVTKGDGTEYDVSGITVYSGGIDFNDGSTTTFYGGSGQTVSLALTAETRDGYHFKQYVASQGSLSGETTDAPTLTMPAANSTANDVVTISAEYDPFSGGTGTSVNPYQIASTADWNLLVSNVNGGETYSGNYFKMTANVGTVETWMTGDLTTTGIFSGHFDGDGHTLTVNYSSDTQYCHPFGFLRGATIENLHVTGNITTSQTYAAGLAGRALSNSTNYITNCLVSTNITSTRSGTANICGVVMSVQANATLYIEGCAFTGSITSNGTDNGGFSEWVTSPGVFSATNCLFAPSSVTDNSLVNSKTFCRNGGTFSGCYYTRTLGTAQGTKAYSITGGNYVTVANAGEATATVYNVSGITSYGTGIQYGGVLYGGNEEAVSLTLTAPEHDGYGFVYSADNGTVTGDSNPYTLTMVDANAIINVKYSASKAINKYTSDDTSDGWYLIASPIDTVNPQDVANMTSESNTFDIYRFNQNPAITIVEGVDKYLEWENWKRPDEGEGGINHYHFDLEPGRGYLYANSGNVTLTFIGTPYSGSGEVTLEYSDGNPKAIMHGWNLVGNPFPVAAYVNRPFYKMNDTGTGIVPVVNDFNSYTPTTIPSCTGIMVQTTAAEVAQGTNKVTFSTTAPAQQATNNGNLQIALSQSNTRGNTVMDNAIVSFNEDAKLGKFYFGTQNANIYIPQGSKDYAIATSNGQGEMPLNFKANENGEYTLTVNPENVEMGYLHLIDNMTGADIDLLQTPEYTFTAKTTDYESRFKLVFSANNEDGASTGSATFAFYSNGNWVIANEGQATLQVIDMQGRILSSETINGSVSTSLNAPVGVYVLRLINGENVKVQKIVVR